MQFSAHADFAFFCLRTYVVFNKNNCGKIRIVRTFMDYFYVIPVRILNFKSVGRLE